MEDFVCGGGIIVYGARIAGFGRRIGMDWTGLWISIMVRACVRNRIGIGIGIFLFADVLQDGIANCVLDVLGAVGCVVLCVCCC